MNRQASFFPGPENEKTFTLIELLIVIAVIVILVSLLLPALGSAKRNAMSIQCIGNLKQLGNAVMMYAGDFNDHFIPNNHPETVNQQLSHLAIYFNARDYSGRFTFYDWKKPKTTTSKVMNCPSAPSQKYNASYGYNSSCMTENVSRSNWSDCMYQRFSQLPKNKRLILIADMNNQGLTPNTFTRLVDHQYYPLRLRHGGQGKYPSEAEEPHLGTRFNALWSDLSVKGSEINPSKTVYQSGWAY